MLTEWAPVFTVTGVLIAAFVGLCGVVYTQRKQERRERENWRRERVYEVARDVTNVVASVHYQEPVPSPQKIVELLRPQFVLLYSLVPNFKDIDEHGAIDRFIDGEGDIRDNIVREIEAMMELVVHDLHEEQPAWWQLVKKRKKKQKESRQVESPDPGCEGDESG